LFFVFVNIEHNIEKKMTSAPDDLDQQVPLDRFSSQDLGATFGHLLQTVKPESNLFGNPALFTDEQIAEIKAGVFPQDQCIFSSLKKGRKTSRSGCARVRIKIRNHSNSEKVLAYQLSAWRAHGRPSKMNTASHLCGNCDCVNPHHLYWEPLAVNHTRDCCFMHRCVPSYLCPHTPPCVGFHDRRA